MSLGSRMQNLWIEYADNVSEVQIAIRQLGHILAAYIAQITFITLSHSV